MKFFYCPHRKYEHGSKKSLRNLLCFLYHATCRLIPMIPKARSYTLLAFLFVAFVPANAQFKAGSITGLVRGSGNSAVGGATMTVTRQDGDLLRGTVSNGDGVYSF